MSSNLPAAYPVTVIHNGRLTTLANVDNFMRSKRANDYLARREAHKTTRAMRSIRNAILNTLLE